MPRYKLIQDFGGMSAGDEITTDKLSDMLKPIAVEIQEAQLEVATPESADEQPQKRPYKRRTEAE